VFWSNRCFQIRRHNIFHSTNFRVFKQIFEIELLPGSVEFNSFKNNFHPNFVPELKAIGQGFLGIVNFYGHTINRMIFDAQVICFIRESMGLDRRIVERRYFFAFLDTDKKFPLVYKCQQFV